MIPAPPKPPHSRLLKDNGDYLCPKCGSTVVKKYWLFGQLKCIHPECGYAS